MIVGLIELVPELIDKLLITRWRISTINETPDYPEP